MAAKRLKIKRIIAKNRAVDAKQFAEATKLIEQLRSSGVAGPSYGLDSPFVRKIRPADAVIGRAGVTSYIR